MGAIVEINSETDFVAKNERFKKFAERILDVILKNKPKNLEELKSLKMSDETNFTVEKALQEEILTIGENIKIRRFSCLEGKLISYVHGNGTIAVLVKFNDKADVKNEKFIEFGKNIAMQIAASNPQYLNSNEIPEKVLNEEKEIFKQQIINSGKPENIVEKIVKGQISKFYKEVSLVDQEYVKDSSLTVGQYCKNFSKEISEDVEIIKFVRMEKGEGIEKKSEDFGSEVFSMLN